MGKVTIALDKDGKADLVGTFEAHLILGVERSRIARFMHDNARGKRKIAEPIAEPQCGPIWTREQLEETAREMFEAAGSQGDFDEWMIERALKRAAALPRPLTAQELEGILGRELSPEQASRLAELEPVAA